MSSAAAGMFEFYNTILSIVMYNYKYDGLRGSCYSVMSFICDVRLKINGMTV